MRTKKIIYIVQIYFTLQSMFMIFWPMYLYSQKGIKFYEMLVLGCIILLSSIFIVVNKNKIRKVATCLLWIYSIAFAVIGTLANLVASPKPTLALSLTIVMIMNIVLLIVYHSHISKKIVNIKNENKRF